MDATAAHANGSTTTPAAATDNASTLVPTTVHANGPTTVPVAATDNASTLVPHSTAACANGPTTVPANTENEMNTENNNEIQINAKNLPISDLSETPSIKEYLNTIKFGFSPPVPFDHHPTTNILQDKFNYFIYNQSVYNCHYCKER